MQISFGDTIFPVSRMFPATSSFCAGVVPMPTLPELSSVAFVVPAVSVLTTLVTHPVD